MNLLNILVILNGLIFAGIICFVATLARFLWTHRKQNGDTQKFRYIILYLALAKLFYFIMEFVAAAHIIHDNLVFDIWILIPILLGSTVLVIVDAYTLLMVRRYKKLNHF